jgi:hypothetical protein
MASPVRSLPPTSPILADVDNLFSFDRSPPPHGNSPAAPPNNISSSGYSPPAATVVSPSTGPLTNGGAPPYFTHPSAASPRTRIKTIAGGSRTAGSSRESSVETLRPCSTGSPAHTLSTAHHKGQMMPTLFSLSDYQVPVLPVLIVVDSNSFYLESDPHSQGCGSGLT